MVMDLLAVTWDDFGNIAMAVALLILVYLMARTLERLHPIERRVQTRRVKRSKPTLNTPC
jgi:hypothetical protein